MSKEVLDKIIEINKQQIERATELVVQKYFIQGELSQEELDRIVEYSLDLTFGDKE